MGSAGAEAGDGVRQEGEGRRGGKQLLRAHGTRVSSCGERKRFRGLDAKVQQQKGIPGFFGSLG